MLANLRKAIATFARIVALFAMVGSISSGCTRFGFEDLELATNGDAAAREGVAMREAGPREGSSPSDGVGHDGALDGGATGMEGGADGSSDATPGEMALPADARVDGFGGYQVIVTLASTLVSPAELDIGAMKTGARLSWDLGDGTYESIEVRRDGSVIATLDITQHTAEGAFQAYIQDLVRFEQDFPGNCGARNRKQHCRNKK